MAEGKKITDLGTEVMLDDTDLLLIGSNGSASLQKTTLAALKSWILGAVYPVGSIFTTTNADTNPSTILGFGTWERISGRMLIGSTGSSGGYPAGKTGGAATVTLYNENVPPHTHTIPGHTHQITVAGTKLTTDSNGKHQHKIAYNKDTAAGSSKNRYVSGGETWSANTTSEEGNHTHTIPSHTHTATCEKSGDIIITGSGSGTPFSNLPPYIAVSIWKRVS